MKESRPLASSDQLRYRVMPQEQRGHLAYICVEVQQVTSQVHVAIYVELERL